MLVVKNLPANAGDFGLVPGLGRSPGEGNGSPLHYSCLENPMERSQVGYSLWGRRESDTTKNTQHGIWVSSEVCSVFICDFTFLRFCDSLPPPLLNSTDPLTVKLLCGPWLRQLAWTFWVISCLSSTLRVAEAVLSWNGIHLSKKGRGDEEAEAFLSTLRGWRLGGIWCHFLLRGILPTRGSNLHLLHWQADYLPPYHQGSPCSCRLRV